MSVTLENWGQLKIVSVDNNNSNSDKGVNEDSSKKPNGSIDSNNKSVFVQLLSLPKIRDRGSVVHVPKPIVNIPISTVASATATTKNDLTLNLKSKSFVTRHKNCDVELTSVRFAIPNVCVGYEETEEAGKFILREVQNEMQACQLKMLRSNRKTEGKNGNVESDENDNLLLMATAGMSEDMHDDEVMIAIFDDVMISYPSGKFKIAISNYNVILEDKRRGVAGGLVSFPLSNIQQIYLCDVPSHFAKTGPGADDLLAQYVVLILKTPLKIRASTYNNVVISCPPYLVLDEAHAWRCELTTQEEINRVLNWSNPNGSNNKTSNSDNTSVTKESTTSASAELTTEKINNANKDDSEAQFPLTPTISGRVSEILVRVFKALAKVPAYGGVNKEYHSVLTQNRHCCLRCLFHGAEGLLYVVNGGLLFLHRPATKLAFSTIREIEMDEAESGSATFQLSVFTQPDGVKMGEKYIFSGIDKVEKDNLLQYLSKKVKLIRRGIFVDDDDDENEDEDEDEDEDDDDEANIKSDEDSETSDMDEDDLSDDDEDEDDDDDASESESDDKADKSKRKRHRHSNKRSRKETHDDDDNIDDDNDQREQKSLEAETKSAPEKNKKHRHKHHKKEHSKHKREREHKSTKEKKNNEEVIEGDRTTDEEKYKHDSNSDDRRHHRHKHHRHHSYHKKE